MLRKTVKSVLALSVLLLAGCGRDDGTGPGEQELSSADINNIAAALTNAVNSGLSSAFQTSSAPAAALAAFPTLSGGLFSCHRVTPGDPTTGAPSRIALFSCVSLCPGGGRITMNGNLSIGSLDPFPISGLISFQVSDPTNNLNDCDAGNGVILDGSLTLTFSGNLNIFTMVLSGTIGINRRGATGGLRPIASDCSIFITYRSTGSASGSICGTAVST